LTKRENPNKLINHLIDTNVPEIKAILFQGHRLAQILLILCRTGALPADEFRIPDNLFKGLHVFFDFFFFVLAQGFCIIGHLTYLTFTIDMP